MSNHRKVYNTSVSGKSPFTLRHQNISHSTINVNIHTNNHHEIQATDIN